MCLPDRTGGFEVIGVKEDRGGDYDGVDVGCEQLTQIGGGSRVWSVEELLRALHAIGNDVAHGRDACGCVLRQQVRYESSPAAGAEESGTRGGIRRPSATAANGTISADLRVIISAHLP